MKCGQAIFVKDLWGSFVLRFIAQCEGRFILISNNLEPRNGYLLNDWRGVLRELVAVTVPAALVEKTRTAESAWSGLYVNFPLTYPLSVGSLASLLDAPADEVRAQLADLAVETDTP